MKRTIFSIYLMAAYSYRYYTNKKRVRHELMIHPLFEISKDNAGHHLLILA